MSSWYRFKDFDTSNRCYTILMKYNLNHHWTKSQRAMYQYHCKPLERISFNPPCSHNSMILPTVKVVAKPVPWALQVVFCSCKKSLRNGVPWCSCFLFLNQVSKRSKPEDFTRKPDGNQWMLLSLQHLYSLLRRTSAMQTPSFFGKHCEGLLLR